MKQLILLGVFLFPVVASISAQDFVTRGKIEYEIRRNNKRMYDDEDRSSSLFYSFPAGV